MIAVDVGFAFLQKNLKLKKKKKTYATLTRISIPGPTFIGG